MEKLDQTLDSREVAEMIEKDHSKLLRDLRRYEEQFIEAKIGFNDFFRNSDYKDSIGRTLPCYRITKKGCEFIAHKLTGIKGTIFTARYINRFHEMQDILSKQESEPQLPWFIHRFRGEYIMLFRDFKTLTGVEICGNNAACKRTDKLEEGRDYNGWGWHTVINKEEFLKEYGFEYGDEECMMYFYPRGIKRALEIYRQESGRDLNQEAYAMISDSLKAIEQPKKEITIQKPEFLSIGGKYGNQLPVQIIVIVGKEAVV